MKSFDGFKADLWSLSSMLFCLLTGKCAYNSPVLTDPWFNMIANGRFKENFHEYGVALSPEAIDFLDFLFVVDIDARPSIEHIMNHPWFLNE